MDVCQKCLRKISTDGAIYVIEGILSEHIEFILKEDVKKNDFEAKSRLSANNSCGKIQQMAPLEHIYIETTVIFQIEMVLWKHLEFVVSFKKYITKIIS